MSTKTPPATDWLVEFNHNNPVPSKSVEYFTSIPWTNKYLQDPAYHTTSAFSRTRKASGEDHFFAKTVATEETIPHYICLQRKEFETPEVTKSTPAQTVTTVKRGPAVPYDKPDCVFLLRIGEKGLDGHPSVLHGGMACAILDETMGFCVVLHMYHLDGPERKNICFTVNLNTTYRAQIATPGELVVLTWLEKREGRKWTARGQIIDKNGVVCTDAHGLWVLVPSQKL